MSATEVVMTALHGHEVTPAPYLGVWECTCGAPIGPLRDQADAVIAALDLREVKAQAWDESEASARLHFDGDVIKGVSWPANPYREVPGE